MEEIATVAMLPRNDNAGLLSCYPLQGFIGEGRVTQGVAGLTRIAHHPSIRVVGEAVCGSILVL